MTTPITASEARASLYRLMTQLNRLITGTLTAFASG